MIIACFASRYSNTIANGLWQYDYGQSLRIQGLTLPAAVEIHFSLHETGGEAVTRVGVTKDGVTDVTIPDNMLEGNDSVRDYKIYAFVYLTDKNSGETTHKIVMPVKARPKPEAFDAPEDAEMFREAIAAVNEAVKNVRESVTPAIGENGNWFVSGEDTGVHAEGPEGKAGVVSWNDLKDKPFYEEGELVEVLPEMSFTIDNGYTYLMSDELDISIGEQYTVVWGGIEYVCTAKERSVAAKDGTITTSTLGNYGLSSASLEDNTGEPFLIVTSSTDIDESGSHTGILVYAASSVYTYTVAVFKGVHTIHSIAGKYIDNDTLKDTPLWWTCSEKTCLVEEMTVTLGTTPIEQLTTTTINNQDLLTIYYDGIRYECTAMSYGYYILCGNLNEFADENSDFAGVGMDMPFVIVITPQGAMIVSAENSNLQEDHTISIYAYQHKYRLPGDYTHYYVDELPEGSKGDFSPLLSADSAGVITHIGTGGRVLTCCSSLSGKTMIAYVKDNAYRIGVYIGDGVLNEMIVPAFEMDGYCNVKTGEYVKIQYYNNDYGIIGLTSDDPSVLTSPNGTKYRITVEDDGTLKTEEVTE